MNESLLRAAVEFWIPTRHVFHFNGVDLCPTLEDIGAIIGKPNVNSLILPTTNEDFSIMAQQLLGISLSTAQKWCMFNKLNIRKVFMYFSQRNVLMARAQRSHYLNAFCLCLFLRYFLVHDTPCVDQRMLWVIINLERGSIVGMILAETLNGLDIVHRGEVTFFVGSPLLL